MSDSLQFPCDGAIDESRIIAAAILAALGYDSISSVNEILRQRLTVLNSTIGEPQHTTIYDLVGIFSSRCILHDLHLRDEAERAVRMAANEEAHSSGEAAWWLQPPQSDSDVNLVLLERLAVSSEALKSSWFGESMRILEEYETAEGCYRFSDELLRERDSGYWILGDYMALGRRDERERELEMESTFWMLLIRHRSGQP